MKMLKNKYKVFCWKVLIVIVQLIVKLRQGSGKDRQGMGFKAKGFKAETLSLH